VLTSALGLTRLATLSFGVIPSGQSLKIRHKAEPFLGIRRQDGLGCHDVDQRRSVLQRATQRAFEFRRLFDALAMRPEGAGEARIVRVAQSGADDAAAIVHFLIQPLDIPGGIVGHDEDHFRAVPHGGVDFHGVDAERTIAIDRDDLTARHGECGCDREGDSDTKTAECARIHVRAGGQPGTGKAQQVAAIRDRDVILWRRGSDRIENGARVNFSVAAGRRPVFRGFRRGNSFTVTLAQAIGPGPVDSAFAIAGGCDHGFKYKMRRGE